MPTLKIYCGPGCAREERAAQRHSMNEHFFDVREAAEKQHGFCARPDCKYYLWEDPEEEWFVTKY